MRHGSQDRCQARAGSPRYCLPPCNPPPWHANDDLFGFQLTAQDMIDLATLDLGEDAAWDATTHEEW